MKRAMTQTSATAVTDADPILNELNGLLGARGVTTDADAMEPWLTDWRGRYHGKARALVQPDNAEQLSALVRLCVKEGIPLVPQGGNSGMVGGATPDESGDAILLSLRRMNDLRVDAERGTAECGAGVILQTLHEAAEDQALRFPLSLGGKGSATVGGLISTNAGGTQVLRHGTMRSLVEGLEVVLADGAILNLTSALKKDNRGFDLKQLWIGSEGTLGIVTRAVLRLVPAIAERRVVWAGVETIHDARTLLLHCQQALPQALEGFEVIPRVCLDHVLDYMPNAQAPLQGSHGWNALIEFVADRESASALGEAVENAMGAALEQGLIEDAVIAASEAQANAFWELRENVPSAERQRGPAKQHDISVPVAVMPELLERAEREIPALFPGVEVVGFGHLGDGNIHLHAVAPQGSEIQAWEKETGDAVSAHIYRMVTQEGGSISAEHGIGQDKLATLRETRDPAALDVMRRVKRALDPDGLLNPGKLV